MKRKQRVDERRQIVGEMICSLILASVCLSTPHIWHPVGALVLLVLERN